MLTPQEWKTVKEKLTRASPKLLLVLACGVLGYSLGWHMKGSDVVMDCKYASAFRFHTDSFNCVRKL
jgi:hypothetical protein